MAMLETDLELLEQHLDGALETAVETQLQARLRTDTELAVALTLLKAQRAVRSAVWQSIEPDAAASDRMVWRIRGAMLNEDRKVAVEPKKSWNTWRITSIGSAAAACMLLGFMFGRVGRNPVVVPITGPSAIVSNTPMGGQMVEYHNTNPAPAVTAVADSASKQKFRVPITNEYGEVVAWQTFDSPEQAKNFTEDLRKTHAQPAAPAASGQTRLVDQEQF